MSETCGRCKKPVSHASGYRFVCTTCRNKKGKNPPAYIPYPGISIKRKVRKIPFDTMAESFIEDAKYLGVEAVIAYREIGITNYYLTGNAETLEEMAKEIHKRARKNNGDPES